MSVFEKYSAYYDRLYQEKDYPGESAYVLRLLRAQNPSLSSLIDLGCGSGRHAREFARAGLRVIGVDRSAEMLREARRAAPEVGFVQSDIVSYKAAEPVDAAVALFHVFSYLTADAQIEYFLANVGASLRPGGLFLFDFWYGPAVLEQKPSVRVKRIESGAYEIVRVAEPHLHEERNVVDVNYTVTIRSKAAGGTEMISESHAMRYFFLPEIEDLLNRAKFRILERCEWMTEAPLSAATWSAAVLAKRR